MALIRIEEHENGVREVVLDRPEAMNAVSTEMANALTAAGEQLREDLSVRAVVVTSSNEKAFCVGADLKERNGFTDEDLRAQRPGNRLAYRALHDLPVPTIAAVDGHALGGGCEIALACDLIVAGPKASFALPEVSVGVIPGGGGTQLLTSRIGWSRAADLIFTARRIDGPEAARLGLADRVVEDAKGEALAMAATIASHSPVGVRNAKAAMRDGLQLSYDEGLDLEDARWHDTAFSADRAEGVRAFAEKRRPEWPGLG
ncbi:enoyl-CoA hydratase/isomerase family protein [Janibacter corallicola]|uniref:enoyl-CoA hydratase/isomerase family protein n=1 Tax=Janibacter corallicola TaxID=415212 RepID=UPI000833F669|nr:enoyl-CoA hydratase-related protein [Janibacter corallicola]